MKTRPLTLLVGLLALCSPALAHHGSVAYGSQVVVLKQAVVTKVNWANPHVLVLFDVTDNGKVVHWVVEAGSPSAVTPEGWTNTSLKPGDVITAYVYQVKNGAPVGRFGKLVLSDGKTFGNLTSSGSVPGDRPADCNQESINGGNEAAACRPDGRKTSNKE